MRRRDRRARSGEALPPGVALWPHFMETAVGQMAALSVAVGPVSTCEMDVNDNPCAPTSAVTFSTSAAAALRFPPLVVPPIPARLREHGESR